MSLCEEEDTDISCHIPVLVKEVVHFLSPRPGGLYLDATLGAGGHTKTIFEKEPRARVIGLDCDPMSIEMVSKDLILRGKNFDFTAIRANFRDVEKIIMRFGGKVDGVIADLGLSSMQISDKERGFSFNSDANLDMRMDGGISGGVTAHEVVNTFPEDELEKIFRIYGDECYAKKIARAIVKERVRKPFGSAKELGDFVARCAGYRREYSSGRKRKIHPATRIFQALRIYVNNELENLKFFLESLTRIVSAGARCVIISFHSGEDRIVKQTFNRFKKDGLGIVLTPKPVFPSQEEIRRNPRSRSARLRAFEFVL